MRESGNLRSAFGGRSGTARFVVVFSTLSVVFVTGCGAEDRDDVLKGFQLELPPCQTEDLTFSGQTSAPGIKMAMSFTASTSCVEQYLKDHQVDLSNPLYWPASGWDSVGGEKISPTEPPFKPESMKQFKLNLDAGKKYKKYIGFRTPKDAEFTVLLDPEEGNTSLYMESRLPGRVGRAD
ncbi:hypothetical protein OG906_37185 (plasmid) [Streptomyces sp. NBC_01426]|uniref:hypothetical protein n=1 Tax=Streptomyces sp. NBC_01426 TaxID=2975866 RepID=UPI002E32F1AA|nr:hypothetical protein [Streptomyces sp. NBC_01426]